VYFSTAAVVQASGQAFRLRAQALALATGLQRDGPVLARPLRYTQALTAHVAPGALCNRFHLIGEQLCWRLLPRARPTTTPPRRRSAPTTRSSATPALCRQAGKAMRVCVEEAGNVKDVFVKETKAVDTRSLADAKLGQQIGDARVDAREARLDADYQVIAEKCDAMAGDAKASCLSAAKASVGKG
jgi:hypothetical protein